MNKYTIEEQKKWIGPKKSLLARLVELLTQKANP